MNINYLEFDLLSYDESLKLQRKLQEEIINENNDEGYFMLLEHPPVITVGLRGKEEHIINLDQIPVFEIERGGEVTLHAPGQIVGYFIFPLKSLQGGLPYLVRGIEDMMIGVLERYQILGERKPGHPGIWVNGYKIGNIGISIKRWVTMHGFSFNVNVDLELFQNIIPCGMVDRKVTSMAKELNRDFTYAELKEIKKLFLCKFEEYFKCKIIIKPSSSYDEPQFINFPKP